MKEWLSNLPPIDLALLAMLGAAGLVGLTTRTRGEEPVSLLVWDRALGRPANPEDPAAPRPRGLGTIDRSGLHRDRGRVIHVGYAPLPGIREAGRWVLIALRELAAPSVERVFADDAEVRAFAFLPGVGHPVAGFPRTGEAFTVAGARRACRTCRAHPPARRISWSSSTEGSPVTVRR